MNIDRGEIIFIVINVALIVGVLIAIVLAGFLLFRRIHVLESRIERLEAKQDPTHPNLTGVFPMPGTSSPISSLAILATDLYIGMGTSIYRLDIYNPVAPQFKSSIVIPTDGPLEDIATSSGHAYVSSMPFGLWVVDITDPVSMTIIGSYQVPGPGRGLDVLGGVIYYACDDAGLMILKDNSR